jgi:hypothetical protein
VVAAFNESFKQFGGIVAPAIRDAALGQDDRHNRRYSPDEA